MNFTWNKYQDAASSEAITLVQSVEVLLESEYIAELSGDSTDLEKTEYIMTKDSLSKFIDVSEFIHFAYIFGEKDGNTIFLLDSETPESSAYSPPGQIYVEATDMDRRPFLTAETVLTQLFILLLAFAGIWTQHLKLKKLELLYHSVFDQAPIGIAVMDSDGHVVKPEFGQNNINKTYEQILGRTNQDLVDTNWREITHPDDLAADVEKFDQFSKGMTRDYSLEKRGNVLFQIGSLIDVNME